MNEDPRHLFLLASSRKYPHVFSGYRGTESQLKGIGLDDISEDAHLIEDLGLDSTDVVAVIFGLEEAFDISISDEEATKCTTLKAVEQAVMERLAAAGA